MKYFKMIKFIIFVFVFMISANAFSNELVHSMDEVVNIVFGEKSEQKLTNEYECQSKQSTFCGKLKADLNLKIIGSDKEKENKIWEFKVVEGETCQKLFIEVPLKQHYMAKGGDLFSGRKVCESGLASSGVEIREYPKYKNVFIAKEWSCGSLGCSYTIILGCEKLKNICGLKEKK